MRFENRAAKCYSLEESTPPCSYLTAKEEKRAL